MNAVQNETVLLELWAKSRRGDEVRGESLIAHTSTVLARVERLFDILPGLAQRVGDDRLWHRAAMAAVLHDFGKAATGFQDQLRNPSKHWMHRHEVLSLAFIDWLLPQDGGGDLPWVAAGIVSHHRDKSLIDARYPPPLGDEDPYDPVSLMVAEVTAPAAIALAELIREQLPQWFNRSQIPVFPVMPAVPQDPASDFWAHATRRIYRALAAYRELFARLEKQRPTSVNNLTAIALRGILLLSDHTASAHEKPPHMPSHDVEAILRCLDRDWQSLYDHQRDAASRGGNALLIAPTGSGKTEAAILWSTHQRATEPAGRLFYVLPYQASINAMHSRLAGTFPELVSLQHSRALQAIYRRLLDNDRYDSQAASLIARRQRSLAALHYHPIRVLTPYQLLRGMFRLKGYEMLLADAVNALMVFDEIHAYEPRRLGMILAMQAYLAHHLGVRTLVMSATLPTVLRELVQRAIGDCATICAPPEVYRSFARHELHLLPGEIDQTGILDKIVDTASAGKSVLVVCNTVHRARTVYDSLWTLLSPYGIKPELLHSRFNSEDRFRKETELNARMGTNNRATASAPIVMVATQVVEVSLDIDFDVLFTEPAPLESLVQRFGRVNRARHYSSCPVYVLTTPLSFPYVYERRYVAAALEQLADCDGNVIDESTIGTRLDKVYSGDIAREWLSQVEEARRETEAACISRLRAFQSEPGLVEMFENLFDGTEVLPRSLLDRYRKLFLEDPIAAYSLLVPISRVQLSRLRADQRLSREAADDLWIADAPYNSDYGLDVSVHE